MRASGQIKCTATLIQKFYAAEGYLQDYLTLHPNQPYIAYNDIPKVEDLSKVFPNLYSAKPKLVKG